MVKRTTISALKTRLLSETTFVVTLLAISIYMFVRSFEYHETSQTFPQLTSSIVVISCVLILISDYLPEPIRQAITESQSIASVDSKQELKPQDDDGNGEVNQADAPHSNLFSSYISDKEFTVVMIVSYTVLSYLFSILLASPVFGIAYFLGTGKPWHYAIGMGVLGVAIPYLLLVLLYIPLDQGLLFGGI